jgi:hypothetical protein
MYSRVQRKRRRVSREFAKENVHTRFVTMRALGAVVMYPRAMIRIPWICMYRRCRITVRRQIMPEAEQIGYLPLKQLLEASGKLFAVYMRTECVYRLKLCAFS